LGRENKIVKWKEFLKPDWRKIVVFVIIVTLSFLTIVKIRVGERWHYELNPIFWIADLFFNFRFFIGWVVEERVWPTLPPMDEWAIYYTLLHSVYWYLLSCLIVCIYDKYKKKKK